MKASQVHRGAKFGEKHVVAAEVNDKAIKKIEIFVRIRQRLNENSTDISDLFLVLKTCLSAESLNRLSYP